MNAQTRQRKNSYISVACQFCKQRHIKCNGKQPCANCSKRKLPCIYLTTGKKRGPKPKNFKPYSTSPESAESLIEQIEEARNLTQHWKAKNEKLQEFICLLAERTLPLRIPHERFSQLPQAIFHVCEVNCFILDPLGTFRASEMNRDSWILFSENWESNLGHLQSEDISSVFFQGCVFAMGYMILGERDFLHDFSTRASSLLTLLFNRNAHVQPRIANNLVRGLLMVVPALIANRDLNSGRTFVMHLHHLCQTQRSSIDLRLTYRVYSQLAALSISLEDRKHWLVMAQSLPPEAGTLCNRALMSLFVSFSILAADVRPLPNLQLLANYCISDYKDVLDFLEESEKLVLFSESKGSLRLEDLKIIKCLIYSSRALLSCLSKQTHDASKYANLAVRLGISISDGFLPIFLSIGYTLEVCKFLGILELFQEGIRALGEYGKKYPLADQMFRFLKAEAQEAFIQNYSQHSMVDGLMIPQSKTPYPYPYPPNLDGFVMNPRRKRRLESHEFYGKDPLANQINFQNVRSDPENQSLVRNDYSVDL